VNSRKPARTAPAKTRPAAKAVAAPKAKVAPKAKAKAAPKAKPARSSSKTKAVTKAKPAARTAAKARPAARRADFGAPIEAYFKRQAGPLAEVLRELRRLIEQSAPDARGSIKWGMPFFAIGDAMMCGLAGHKGHVNLVLSGPGAIFHDPRGLLLGDGKTGRHLKLTRVADLPHADVQRWLTAAAARARAS
jgi:hypothetical protein